MIGSGFDAALDGARHGDEASFAALWRDLQPPLLRYLVVAAGASAEDVASETWTRVTRDLSRFDGDEAGFRGWVFTIARHRLLDWRRREARARTAPRPIEHFEERRAPDDPEMEALERLSTDASLHLVARLPADQAEVVMLRAVGGLDVPTVARVLGKRPGTVRVLAHRGLRRLAELLAADTPHEDPSAGVVTP